jgi:hypothetical protein
MVNMLVVTFFLKSVKCVLSLFSFALHVPRRHCSDFRYIWFLFGKLSYNEICVFCSVVLRRDKIPCAASPAENFFWPFFFEVTRYTVLYYEATWLGTVAQLREWRYRYIAAVGRLDESS